MKYKPVTPEMLEFYRKELKYHQAQIKDNHKLLAAYERGESKDWRDADLSRANIASSRRQIDNILLAVTYGEYSFNPPGISTENWDFEDWCNYLEACGVEPLRPYATINSI